MSKRRLGKGIDALLQGRPLEQLSQISSIMMVPLDDITPNPDQPRKQFDQQSLNELADSIREKGIIQPLIAEDRGDGSYVIIAGERRYRAAKLAGLEEVPVISQELDDEEKLEIALIENIQREDLNAIDEARALQHAMEQGGLTQEQLAKRLGKSRSAIANALRLLRLDQEMQDAIVTGTLTAGHARALLALNDEAERRRLFERVRDEGLSVREAEIMVKGGRLDEGALETWRDELTSRRSGAESSAGASDARSGRLNIQLEEDELETPAGGKGRGSGSGGTTKSVELDRLERLLVDHLGTRVVIRGSNERGRIEINYLSMNDLERVIESMGADPSGET